MGTLSSLTRRSFLRGMGTAGLGIFIPRLSRASEREEIRISLLHTTDLHGHILPTATYEGEADLGGLARCATAFRKWQQENPHHLLLDIGDVYQGTDVGLRTRGEIMMQLFNMMGYDGWVVGNHEFDWGLDTLASAAELSQATVLTANATIERCHPDQIRGGLGKIAPFFIKKVAGFRLGVIGLTTPGLPYWFPEQTISGFEAGDPVPAAIRAAKDLREQGVDAIILATHMGIRAGGDDFANRLNAVSQAIPDAAVILAGHTHQNLSGTLINGIPCCQPGYFGIYAGRTDLYFDAITRKLNRVATSTHRMDATWKMDPAVLSLSTYVLEDSMQALATPVGVLNEALEARPVAGTPSDVENLIGVAIQEALNRRGIEVDAVFHGPFGQEPIPAGSKTVADMWKIIPFENQIITGDLTPAEIETLLGESFTAPDKIRGNLMGIKAIVAWEGGRPQIRQLSDRSDTVLSPDRRYKLAFNTFDASSAGQRLMKLRAILRQPETQATLHSIQTREAVITLFNEQGDDGISRELFRKLAPHPDQGLSAAPQALAREFFQS